MNTNTNNYKINFTVWRYIISTFGEVQADFICPEDVTIDDLSTKVSDMLFNFDLKEPDDVQFKEMPFGQYISEYGDVKIERKVCNLTPSQIATFSADFVQSKFKWSILSKLLMENLKKETQINTWDELISAIETERNASVQNDTFGM